MFGIFVLIVKGGIKWHVLKDNNLAAWQ